METKAFLGIDVSKGYADFLLLGVDKKPLDDSFQLYDTSRDREQLKRIIIKWFAAGISCLYCGVESTGGYENNWYAFIKQLSSEFNIHVARLNARGVKAVSDAALKRTITDAVSAENIAVYLISFPEKVKYAISGTHAVEGEFKEGRQHYTYIKMQQKQKVQLVNQLEKLLYQYFGEVVRYCRHGIPVWLLRMLSKYPCAAAVVKAGPERLAAIKGISAAKAEALLAKVSTNDQQAGIRIQHVIQMTSKEILHKEELLSSEKTYLAKGMKDNEDIKLVDSIPGIGLNSAVPLVLEIETVNRFEACKQLVSNFGVHPTFKQSGDGTWGRHMSKKGPGEVRAILYMCSLTAIRSNDLFKQLYARFRAKGMNHYQAIGVVMHKMLRIIYGVLKSKRSFDAEIDKKNIGKSAEKNSESEKQKSEIIKKQIKHRYQSDSEHAPVSRMHAQQKKKQSASQSS